MLRQVIALSFILFLSLLSVATVASDPICLEGECPQLPLPSFIPYSGEWYCNSQQGTNECNTNVTSAQNYDSNLYSVYAFIPWRNLSLDPGSIVYIDYYMEGSTTQPSGDLHATIRCTAKVNGTEVVMSSTRYQIGGYYDSVFETRKSRFYCFMDTWANISHYGINASFETSSSRAWLYNEYTKSNYNVSGISANFTQTPPSNSTENATIFVESQIWYGKGSTPSIYLGTYEQRPLKNPTFNTSDWWATDNGSFSSAGVLIANGSRKCNKILSPQSPSCVEQGPWTINESTVWPNSSHLAHLNLTAGRLYGFNITYTVVYKNSCTSTDCPLNINMTFRNGSTSDSSIQFGVSANGSSYRTLYGPQVYNLTIKGVTGSLLATCAHNYDCPEFSLYIKNITLYMPTMKNVENNTNPIYLNGTGQNVTYEFIDPSGAVNSTISPVYMNSSGHVNSTFTFPYRTQAGKWKVRINVSAPTSVRTDNVTHTGVVSVLPVINETKIIFYNASDLITPVTDSMNRLNLNDRFHINTTIFNNPYNLPHSGQFVYYGRSYSFISCNIGICTTLGKPASHRSTVDSDVTDSGIDSDPTHYGYAWHDKVNWNDDGLRMHATRNGEWADPGFRMNVTVENKFELTDAVCQDGCLPRYHQRIDYEVYDKDGVLIDATDRSNNGTLTNSLTYEFMLSKDPRAHKYKLTGNARIICRSADGRLSCVGDRERFEDLDIEVYQTNLSFGGGLRLGQPSPSEYNSSNETHNTRIVYYGEVGYHTLNNNYGADVNDYADPTQNKMNVTLYYPNGTQFLKNTETILPNGFFNGSFSLPLSDIPDAVYKIHFNHSNLNSNGLGDEVSRVVSVSIRRPDALIVRSNETGDRSINVTVTVDSVSGSTGDGYSVSLPAINVSNKYNLTLDKVIFNRGETLIVGGSIKNVRGELIDSTVNMSLLNTSRNMLASKNTTVSDGSFTFDNYTFLSGDYVGTYTVNANDSHGNYDEYNITLSNDVQIYKYFINAEGYNDSNNFTYFTGEGDNISKIYSWLEIRNARGELTGQFDNITLTFSIKNPNNGTETKTFNATYAIDPNGNYTLVALVDDYRYMTGNATATVLSYDDNNNTDVVIGNATAVDNLTRNMTYKYTLTNISVNDTRVLRTQSVNLNLKAYDSWQDLSDNNAFDASAGHMSDKPCTFTTKIYNDSGSVDQGEDMTAGDNGAYSKNISINENFSVGYKDVYLYTYCQGMDGVTWNNISNTTSFNDTTGVFLVDDLNPTDLVFDNQNSGVVPVYEQGDAVSMIATFLYAYDSAVPANEVYKNMTMRVVNSSGGLVSNISGNSQYGNQTNANGQTIFNFTIGNSVTAGAYYVNISTLHGSINKTFYVSDSGNYQYSGIQTVANGSAYYERNFTLINNENAAKTFYIKHQCPSGGQDLNSTDTSKDNGNLPATYNCTDRTVSNLAAGGSQPIRFIYKKDGVINLTYSSWIADNSKTNTEDLQYVYRNLTFHNGDSDITFSNVSYTITSPTGGNCFNYCNHTNGTAIATAGILSNYTANASGDWVDVTSGNNREGVHGPSGVWEQDTSKTSTPDTQYIRQLITASLADTAVGEIGGLFESLSWTVTSRSTPQCSTNWQCISGQCSGSLRIPQDGSVNTTYANASGDCVDETSGEWVQYTDLTSRVNGTVHIRGKLNVTSNEDAVVFSNLSYDNSVASSVARANIGSWSCSVDSGTIRVGTLSTNSTTDRPIKCNSTSTIVNYTYGSELNLQVPSGQKCSYRYAKNVSHTNRDSDVQYLNLLSNVSVSKKMSTANANVTCGDASVAYSLDASNSTNFTLNISASADQVCTLYWDAPGIVPSINTTLLNTTIVASKGTVKVDLVLNDTDTDAEKVKTTIRFIPVDGDITDYITACADKAGVSGVSAGLVNGSCNFDTTTISDRNIEKQYNIQVITKDDAECKTDSILSDKSVWIDTLKPRVASVSRNVTSPSLSDALFINISLEDLNLSQVNVSFLPNNSKTGFYINQSINLGHVSGKTYLGNYTFNLPQMEQLYGTTNGTRIKYFIYAQDEAGNLFKSSENSFFIPCKTNYQQLEIQAKPVSVLTGETVTSGTATVDIYHTNGTKVDTTSTAIHSEEEGGLSTAFCKQSFLTSGEKYRAVIRIKSGQETSYHIEEFTAP